MESFKALTSKQMELILAMVRGDLSKDAFLRLYPIKQFAFHEHITSILEHAIAQKDPGEVDCAIWIMYLDPDYVKPSGYVNLLIRLLEEPWHFRHEDIASCLQSIKSPDSVDALYNACYAKFKYLDYDDTYALARKCIHALGDINTASSREKLLILSASDIPIIREKAQNQILRNRDS